MIEEGWSGRSDVFGRVVCSTHLHVIWKYPSWSALCQISTLECNFALNWYDYCFSLYYTKQYLWKQLYREENTVQTTLSYSWQVEVLQNVSQVKCLLLCSLIDQKGASLHFSPLMLYWLTTDNEAQYMSFSLVIDRLVIVIDRFLFHWLKSTRL